ncbi:C-C motif chemokine 5-like [Tiliqua scincoides]|uniref:C-C motif chemokine 5-like n=1 Tax=Tiliqua scincoides TaxID=71010 RepID=UPI003461A038
MKISVALLAALLLLCAALSPAEAGPGLKTPAKGAGVAHSWCAGCKVKPPLLPPTAGIDLSPCCRKHDSRRISKHQVKDFFYTGPRCPLSSVVFMRKNNRQFCADRQAAWVQELLAALEQKPHLGPATLATTPPAS